MPKSRARSLGRPIPLLILATAVLIGTFSGVGYAAGTRSAPKTGKSAVNPASDWASANSPPTTTPSASSKLVFHPLTLLNGATSAQQYGTGAPQYAVSPEGVVYLAGSLNGPANQALPAFIMPKAVRPGYYDCFSVYSENNGAVVMGALHIYANGRALAQGPGTSDFYSLSGVSYVVGY
ncbi:MAG: hypothetical protein ABSA14_11340 [Acidimicrobiales bacterium]|jgi:hypothetical protein